MRVAAYTAITTPASPATAVRRRVGLRRPTIFSVPWRRCAAWHYKRNGEVYVYTIKLDTYAFYAKCSTTRTNHNINVVLCEGRPRNEPRGGRSLGRIRQTNNLHVFHG